MSYYIFVPWPNFGIKSREAPFNGKDMKRAEEIMSGVRGKKVSFKTKKEWKSFRDEYVTVENSTEELFQQHGVEKVRKAFALHWKKNKKPFVNMNDGDTLVINAHGDDPKKNKNPKIGLASKIEFSAKGLANFLKSQGLPKNKKIIIKVFACHSGEECKGQRSFVERLHKALEKLGYSQIVVYGYPGVVRKRNYLMNFPALEDLADLEKLPDLGESIDLNSFSIDPVDERAFGRKQVMKDGVWHRARNYRVGFPKDISKQKKVLLSPTSPKKAQYMIDELFFNRYGFISTDDVGDLDYGDIGVDDMEHEVKFPKDDLGKKMVSLPPPPKKLQFPSLPLGMENTVSDDKDENPFLERSLRRKKRKLEGKYPHIFEGDESTELNYESQSDYHDRKRKLPKKKRDNESLDDLTKSPSRRRIR